MASKQQIYKDHIPKHVAIIMDGNGRWAKQRGLDRSEGHRQGVESVRNVIQAALDLGISYLTLYTFSSENWNRPKDEIEALMNLLVWAIERETPDLMEKNVRLLCIEDQDSLPEVPRQRLKKCMEQTANNTALSVVLAISYSSRNEIVSAVKKISTEVKNGQLNVNDINEKLIPEYLTTRGIPDPDLLIRTGGELRISNFLLWQLSYSELYFTDVYWPDFGKEELEKAVLDYQMRERRFGKTSEQL
ncbi:MAG: isoprenyl transferase [Candidatus Azobacteroides sp.]|nr:isoprenyl transferase [Candidatus Azobacteroides sp.]